MKKILSAALLAILSAAPASAFFVDPSITQLSGSHGYEGSNASVDFGGAFHLMPSFSQYHSDLSAGDTYKTYSLRAAYDQSFWGVGLTGGATPGITGSQYKDNFYGADGVVSFGPGTGKVSRLRQYQEASEISGLTPMSSQPEGLAGVDLGAGVMHYDQTDAALSGTGSAKVGQTNLRGSVGAAFLDNIATVDLTKSVYNGSLAQSGPAQVQMIEGVNAIVQGFPDTSVSLKLSMGMLPMITPYVSYTHTTFKNGAGASGAYVVGGAVDLLMVNVHAFYERYTQIGAADQNFVGIGAGLNF
ncbi:MAG: hypothetical protein ACYCPQ_02870 [Elusimicrobiota bacterium]